MECCYLLLVERMQAVRPLNNHKKRPHSPPMLPFLQNEILSQPYKPFSLHTFLLPCFMQFWLYTKRWQKNCGQENIILKNVNFKT
jgi:hypothetical protein